MIPFPASDCWFVGKEFRSIRNGSKVVATFTDITQEHTKRDFDNIDCGPNDLCVTHLMFSGDSRVLEFINRCVAERYDLPTRIVRVEFDNPTKALFNGDLKPSNPAAQILYAPVVHVVIPRAQWLKYKADSATRLAELKAELGCPPTTEQVGR